jgi:hypothetical protein
MVPVAIGTQTVGSTIRPASYCGVVGYMPSHQILPVQGVKVQAGSLDNLGILTRSVGDVALAANAIFGCDALHAEPLAAPPRIGFCPSPHWPQAHRSTRQVMADASALLRKSGANVEQVELPASFDDALPAHWTILAFEFARAMAFEYEAHHDQLSPRPSQPGLCHAVCRILRRLCDRNSLSPGNCAYHCQLRCALDTGRGERSAGRATRPKRFVVPAVLDPLARSRYYAARLHRTAQFTDRHSAHRLVSGG